jgi:S-adenosylmethionine:tRNA ribosyltransferase-isomerase
MMVVDRRSQSFEDKHFSDVVSCLRADDLLVVNNTQVFPARLFGKTPTGARVELFLIRSIAGTNWECLARPGRRLKAATRIDIGPGFSASVLEKMPDGHFTVRFECDGDLDAAIDMFGKTPVPPYIRRDADEPDKDRERYQTIYAAKRGAIAAPTAGLHFTDEILRQIRKKGVEIVEVTLHVGYGTFEPVRVDELAKHRVAAEEYDISDNAARVIEAARVGGRRIVAVGTTTTRALESNYAEFGEIMPGKRMAGITILPGYEFKVVDALLTNFHLPQSSLLILVSTFAGFDLIMRAYEHAIREKYRFYSYGDCMFIS